MSAEITHADHDEFAEAFLGEKYMEAYRDALAHPEQHTTTDPALTHTIKVRAKTGNHAHLV